MRRARIISNLLKYRGSRSLTRILLNTRVEDLKLDGLTVDLGSGKGAYTYYDHIADVDRDKVITVNIAKEAKPDVLSDLEVGLPFRNNSLKNVLLFNLLEHVYNYQNLCSEVYRVLEKGGRCYIFVAFLYRIHLDPNDYFRYSESALHNVLSRAGFTNVKVESLGFGAFTTSWFFLSSTQFLKLPLLMLFPLCLRIDELIARRTPKDYNLVYSAQYPLAYFVTGIKEE